MKVDNLKVVKVPEPFLLGISVLLHRNSVSIAHQVLVGNLFSLVAKMENPTCGTMYPSHSQRANFSTVLLVPLVMSLGMKPTI